MTQLIHLNAPPMNTKPLNFRDPVSSMHLFEFFSHQYCRMQNWSHPLDMLHNSIVSFKFRTPVLNFLFFFFKNILSLLFCFFLINPSSMECYELNPHGGFHLHYGIECPPAIDSYFVLDCSAKCCLPISETPNQ